jgi:hypothetical protein
MLHRSLELLFDPLPLFFRWWCAQRMVENEIRFCEPMIDFMGQDWGEASRETMPRFQLECVQVSSDQHHVVIHSNTVDDISNEVDGSVITVHSCQVFHTLNEDHSSHVFP